MNCKGAKHMPSQLTERNRNLLEQYAQTKSPEVMQQIVIQNKLLAWKIAQKHSRFGSSSLTVEDLFHEGITGLIEAISRFKIEKGYALSTYSTWWIERNIRRAKAEKGEMIRYPENFSRILSKVRRVLADFEGSESMHNVLDALQNMTGMDKSEILKILTTDFECGQIQSLQERRMADEHQRECAEELSYENQRTLICHFEYQNAAELCCVRDRKKWLEKAIATLSTEQRAIVEMNFGMRDTQPQTLAEIARLMGISKGKVKKLLNESLLQIRQMFHDWNISFEDVA
jgi:RNA polymerase sigma factor (sigma-70 family)